LLEGLAMDAAGMRAFVERPERFGPILRLFGGSQPLSDLLIHRPSLMLDPALDRALARERTLSAHVSALRDRVRRCRSFAEALASLRRYQQGELLLTGLKDVNRQITIRAVRRALSDLAEASVRGAWAAAAARLRREGGERPSPMAVLGLGRLGYREMDYGSDLDLVFVYDSAEDDAHTHANACTFATFVVEALDTITREGPLYAVDSRLRPFGSEGELAQSQRTLVAYLEGPAGVWEMQSYLKARPVAGDLRFGDRVVRRAEQAILERASRQDPAPEIRSMRERLMEAAGAGGEDLKSGRGGTHAVQFALHYLQLSRHVASPHGKSTARLMRHLRDMDVLDEKSYTALYRGERFLRRMEHQLRLLHGRSVTRVPGSTDRLAEVARGLDYRGPAGKAVAKMLRDLEATRRAVEDAFDSVVAPESPRRH
ncbi:MAG TPA: DUF294 nucleotidyltransferase-like domain-containing protein, partial [Candidatus Saccharimonadales bacterium]|nr:DUF294 nucleotidyltransferase-like domain-containing protein [Candidatus Saccharimonadales bacterium]